MKSTLDRIGSETLLEAFRGYGKCGYRNLVYFAACNVLCGSGEKFARDFLAASGCRAVIGYTTNVDWMQSLVTDMLFLQRFYTAPDPWRTDLAAIFASVEENYSYAGKPRATRCWKPKTVRRLSHMRKRRLRFRRSGIVIYIV